MQDCSPIAVPSSQTRVVNQFRKVIFLKRLVICLVIFQPDQFLYSVQDTTMATSQKKLYGCGDKQQKSGCLTLVVRAAKK